MSIAKWLLIAVAFIVAVGLGFSALMASQGKPTLWGLVAAPVPVNSPYLLGEDNQVQNNTWTIHSKDRSLPLYPCGESTYENPKASEDGHWCSEDGSAELKTVSDITTVSLDGVRYRFDCEDDKPGEDPFQKCSLNPWMSLFGS